MPAKCAESARFGDPVSIHLPFIRDLPDGRSFWHVPVSDAPLFDHELGRALAWRLVEAIRAGTQRKEILMPILAAMIRAGQDSSVEMGFASGLAEALAKSLGGTLI